MHLEGYLCQEKKLEASACREYTKSGLRVGPRAAQHPGGMASTETTQKSTNHFRRSPLCANDSETLTSPGITVEGGERWLSHGEPEEGDSPAAAGASWQGGRA